MEMTKALIILLALASQLSAETKEEKRPDGTVSARYAIDSDGADIGADRSADGPSVHRKSMRAEGEDDAVSVRTRSREPVLPSTWPVCPSSLRE